MAVEIQLLHNDSKDLVVDKSLTPVATYNGTFRETVDSLRPTFILQGNVAANVNYAYIPAFGRFYYVTDRKEVTKDLTELSLYTDVRKSFATQLYAAKGVVQRNSQLYDMYLNDPKIPVGAHKALTIKKFNTPFSNYAGISMLVLGGGYYVPNP